MRLAQFVAAHRLFDADDPREAIGRVRQGIMERAATELGPGWELVRWTEHDGFPELPGRHFRADFARSAAIDAELERMPLSMPPPTRGDAFQSILKRTVAERRAVERSLEANVF